MLLKIMYNIAHTILTKDSMNNTNVEECFVLRKG